MERWISSTFEPLREATARATEARRASSPLSVAIGRTLRIS
jgi:hypothetical protein